MKVFMNQKEKYRKIRQMRSLLSQSAGTPFHLGITCTQPPIADVVGYRVQCRQCGLNKDMIEADQFLFFLIKKVLLAP